MVDKHIFIADGHHRYETALNYRNIFRQRYGTENPQASYEYVMVYLTDMFEPGLVILPTHRLLRNIGTWDPGQFIERAKNCFDVERFESKNGGELRWRETIEAGGRRKDTTIGFYCREAACLYALTAKREAVTALLARKGAPAPLQALDVAVFDQIVLRDLLGVSDQFLADERNISYTHDFDEAVAQVKSGRYDAGFFVNHTRIEQVREIADAGLTMPHKSTYFYPKVMSGLVVSPLSPDEEIS